MRLWAEVREIVKGRWPGASNPLRLLHWDNFVVPRRETVRRIVSQLLIGLIALCPLVCGAEAVEPCHQDHHAIDHDSSPAQCPDDGDNCICQGAIQANVFRISLPSILGHPFLMAEPIVPSSTLLPPLLGKSILTGCGSPGIGVNPRAALQNFRC